MNKSAEKLILKDTYAVLEMTRHRMSFSVCKYIDKTIKPLVVFSQTINQKFLNERDIVENPLHAKNALAGLLSKYESSFHEEIKAIILILPTNTLSIDESTETVYADEGKKLISNDILKKELFDKIKDARLKPSKSVVKIKPKYWILDNEKYIDFPYERLCTKIQLVGLNYSIDNEVLESHTNVINTNNRQILMKDFQNHVKAIKIVPPMEFVSENVVVIEINKENHSYGLYKNEGCFKFVNMGKESALDGMITTIARKLKIRPNTVNNYLFNLLDFNELGQESDIIYFRKTDQTYNQEVTMTKTEILEEFKNYISHFVSSIEKILKASTTKNLENLRVYIVGDIAKISGIEVVFKKCFKISTKLRLYIPLGVGEEDEATTVALGAAEEMLLFNNTIYNNRYVTSTNDFIRERKIGAQEYERLRENVPDGYTILPNLNVDMPSKKANYNLEHAPTEQMYIKNNHLNNFEKQAYDVTINNEFQTTTWDDENELTNVNLHSVWDNVNQQPKNQYHQPYQNFSPKDQGYFAHANMEPPVNNQRANFDEIGQESYYKYLEQQLNENRQSSGFAQLNNNHLNNNLLNNYQQQQLFNQQQANYQAQNFQPQAPFINNYNPQPQAVGPINQYQNSNPESPVFNFQNQQNLGFAQQSYQNPILKAQNPQPETFKNYDPYAYANGAFAFKKNQ